GIENRHVQTRSAQKSCASYRSGRGEKSGRTPNTDRPVWDQYRSSTSCTRRCHAHNPSIESGGVGRKVACKDVVAPHFLYLPVHVYCAPWAGRHPDDTSLVPCIGWQLSQDNFFALVFCSDCPRRTFRTIVA